MAKRAVTQHRAMLMNASGRRAAQSWTPKIAERAGHDPVDQRRFFEICDAVQAGGDPIAALEHVACDLRLNCVDIVHQVRRTDDQGQKDAAGNQKNKKIYTETAGEILEGLNVLSGIWIFHCSIHRNSISMPHR